MQVNVYTECKCQLEAQSVCVHVRVRVRFYESVHEELAQFFNGCVITHSQMNNTDSTWAVFHTLV